MDMERNVETEKTKIDSTKVAIWSIFVSVVLGISSHFAAWAIDREDANDTAIEAQISGKIQVLNKATDLISSMRLVHSDIKKECKYFPERLSNKKFLLEAALKRNKIGYELITLAGLVVFYFGDNVRKALEDINNFDASITTEQICAQTAPGDNEYHIRQTKITKMAAQLINQERNKI